MPLAVRHAGRDPAGARTGAVKPMWLEDPVPPDNIEAMARVTHAINVPVCTGENLYGRQGFRKLIEMQATLGGAHRHSEVGRAAGVEEDFGSGGSLLHLDGVPQSGESGGHDRVVPRGVGDARVSRSTSWRSGWTGGRTWWSTKGRSGRTAISPSRTSRGYGIEMNPDVAKAHLAPGESLVGVESTYCRRAPRYARRLVGVASGVDRQTAGLRAARAAALTAQ